MNGIGFGVDRARAAISTDAILSDGNDLAALKEDRDMIVGRVFGGVTIFLTQNIGVQKFVKPGGKHLCHLWNVTVVSRTRWDLQIFSCDCFWTGDYCVSYDCCASFVCDCFLTGGSRQPFRSLNCDFVLVKHQEIPFQNLHQMNSFFC